MHPFSTTRLVVGLLYLGVAGLWLADRAGWVSDSSYLFPILLILVGLISLLAFALRGVVQRLRDRRAARPDLDDTDSTDTDRTDIHHDEESLR